jgi:gliding motility-associated-like protein
MHSLAQCGACKYQVNLVNNGAFSSGNSGFSSELNYVTGIFTCPLCPENTYTIGANAIFYHSGFSGSDHTNPPNGNFFIANGQGQSGSQVWCETLNVQANTDYVFSFWARDVNSNNDPHPFALLQASLNGALSTDTLVAQGGWQLFTIDWNSGDTTLLQLCIVNQQSQTGGNDFGLDDISFTGCHDYHLAHAANAGDDATVCSNETVQLGSAPHSGYTYTWNNAANLSASNVANPLFAATNTSGENITLEYILTTDSAGVGCITSDTIMITLEFVPDFSLGADTSICAYDTLQLSANAVWNSIEWSTSSTAFNIEATAGSYWAQAQYNNCVVSDTINIVEIILPQINLGADTTICSNNTLTLQTDYIGQWSNGSTADSVIVNESGTITFSLTQNNCTVSDTILVTVFEYPQIILPADTLFCEGTTLTLDAHVSGLWNYGFVGQAATINEPGYYDIIVENGPCQAQQGTQVSIVLLPVANLPSESLVCEGEYFYMDAYAPQNQTYLWSTGDTASHIQVNNAATYTVNVSNNCGSQTSSMVLDTYLCDWQLFVPNACTPNDDGINETWMVRGYNVTNVKIFVYNRQGQPVFYTTNMDEEWAPGIGIGDDVYNYRIEALSFNNEKIYRFGHIYLLR